jgi:hypothetical protein
MKAGETPKKLLNKMGPLQALDPAPRQTVPQTAAPSIPGALAELPQSSPRHSPSMFAPFLTRPCCRKRACCPCPGLLPRPLSPSRRWGSVASGQAASHNSRPRPSSILLYSTTLAVFYLLYSCPTATSGPLEALRPGPRFPSDHAAGRSPERTWSPGRAFPQSPPRHSFRSAGGPGRPPSCSLVLCFLHSPRYVAPFPSIPGALAEFP